MENNKSVTAVEWLVEQLPQIQQQGLRDIWEQALELEKQQIIDAYQNGNIDGQIFALTRNIHIENGEQYYNEKFQNNNNK
jgi:hypothetical protein